MQKFISNYPKGEIKSLTKKELEICNLLDQGQTLKLHIPGVKGKSSPMNLYANFDHKVRKLILTYESGIEFSTLTPEELPLNLFYPLANEGVTCKVVKINRE